MHSQINNAVGLEEHLKGILRSFLGLIFTKLSHCGDVPNIVIVRVIAQDIWFAMLRGFGQCWWRDLLQSGDPRILSVVVLVVTVLLLTVPLLSNNHIFLL